MYNRLQKGRLELCRVGKMRAEYEYCLTGAELVTAVYDRLRWLYEVFLGQYIPSLSINHVTINKDLEKLPPQLLR